MVLVSCVMVTQESRRDLVNGAIECYRRQTYNPSELVIIHYGSIEYGNYLKGLVSGLKTRLVAISPAITLGAARNTSVRNAAGEIICQWDDDDLHHPERIRAQLTQLQSEAADATYLNEQYHLFRDTRELYVHRAHKIHGTAMFRAGLTCRYPEEGPRAWKGEDSAFIECLHRGYRVVGVSNRPELYLRVFHGKNTWDAAHHRAQVRNVESATSLRELQEKITRDALGFGLSGVTLMGRDGPAFTID